MEEEDRNFLIIVLCIVIGVITLVSILTYWVSENYESITGKITKAYPIEDENNQVVKFRIFFDNGKSYEITADDYSYYINGYSDRLTIQLYKYKYHDIYDYHISQVWKLDSYKDIN